MDLSEVQTVSDGLKSGIRQVVVGQDAALDLLPAIDARPTGIDRMAHAVIADGFARERQLVIRQLTHLGVHCLETPVDAVGPELINRYIAIKRLELI